MRSRAPPHSENHASRALLFFFSSRRRHTRCLSDWSSDVCSSDLIRRSGQKLRLLIRRVGELIAALTSFPILFQKPVHRAQRTVIHAFIQQGGVYRSWRAVLEALLMQIG